MSIKNLGFWIKLEQLMSALKQRNRAYAAVVDGLLVLVCWHITYLFRLGFERWQPERPWYDDYVSVGVIAVYLMSSALAGVPSALWRFFGLDDFKRLTLACLGAGTLNACWIQLAKLVGVPRAVLVLHPFFCLLTFALVRMVYRLVWEHARERAGGEAYEEKRAIVLGAGEVARRLVSAIHRHEGWTVLAMLDDDPAKHGLRFGGVTVQGGIADLALPHVLAGATHVLISMPEADDTARARAVHLAKATGLSVMTISDRVPLQAEGAV